MLSLAEYWSEDGQVDEEEFRSDVTLTEMSLLEDDGEYCLWYAGGDKYFSDHSIMLEGNLNEGFTCSDFVG